MTSGLLEFMLCFINKKKEVVSDVEFSLPL